MSDEQATRDEIANTDRKVRITRDRAIRECRAHGADLAEAIGDGVDVTDAGALLRWLGY